MAFAVFGKHVGGIALCGADANDVAESVWKDVRADIECLVKVDGLFLYLVPDIKECFSQERVSAGAGDVLNGFRYRIRRSGSLCQLNGEGTELFSGETLLFAL